MNSTVKKIAEYCEELSNLSDPLLLELERETHLKTLSPQMISGPIQGKFLEFWSALLRPRSILEIGSFTGYASICLARGLAPEGQLTTIEVNPELEWILRKYFKKAGLEDKINIIIGNAKVIIPGLSGPFDLVFIDAAKPDNAWYYQNLVEKVLPGGFILVDNTLWSGKVIQKSLDADTQLIRAFNQMVKDDPRVEQLILPIRDGLSLIRKV